MENVPTDPVCIVGVNISCCKACPGKLKKALLKINGIHSVVVDPKKCIVSVTGNIDPVKLVRKIRKMGKNTELLSYEKYPINLEEKKKDVHEKETEKEDCCFQFENDHYAKRTTFQDHEPVHFAKPQTEFFDHICGDVRTAVHWRHPLPPRSYGSINHGFFFDPDYPIRCSHYPMGYRFNYGDAYYGFAQFGIYF